MFPRSSLPALASIVLVCSGINVAIADTRKVPPPASNQSGYAIAQADNHRRVVDADGTLSRQSAQTQNRIVIQVNEEDPKKWHAVLVNIRNVQTELGVKNVRIAVVAISHGLGMLTADSLAANGVQDALATGVEFLACGNSMRAQHVSRDDLIEGVGVVNAGYVELMRRQQQGWAYLRP